MYNDCKVCNQRIPLIRTTIDYEKASVIYCIHFHGQTRPNTTKTRLRTSLHTESKGPASRHERVIYPDRQTTHPQRGNKSKRTNMDRHSIESTASLPHHNPPPFPLLHFPRARDLNHRLPSPLEWRRVSRRRGRTTANWNFRRMQQRLGRLTIDKEKQQLKDRYRPSSQSAGFDWPRCGARSARGRLHDSAATTGAGWMMLVESDW